MPTFPFYKTGKKIHSPVKINPATGEWAEDFYIRCDCRLHFVAVSNFDAAAVWPESLKNEAREKADQLHQITHWYGRVGGATAEENEWNVSNII